jgi:Secretion system C-terminal sorting domain
MKKFTFALFLLCLLSVAQLAAQCAPSPRSTGTTFAFGVTDSVTPALFVPQPFVVCDNASLYYYGNNPDTVYLEGSARLFVESCFNLVVYMRSNSQLRCYTTSVPRIFSAVTYDPTFTTFVDTAGSTFQSMTSCMAMSYNYQHFPNGNSPCGTATAISDQATSTAWQAFPNPTQGLLNVDLPASWLGKVETSLFGMDGRLVMTSTIMGPHANIDLENLPAGNYLMRLTQASKSLARVVRVE